MQGNINLNVNCSNEKLLTFVLIIHSLIKTEPQEVQLLHLQS